jgi:hypothetical protein
MAEKKKRRDLSKSLGGMAGKAGFALRNRRAQLDAAINGTPVRRKKPKKR